MAKSIEEIRAGIPSADLEPWDAGFLATINDLLDLNQALADALAAAGAGTAMVLSARTTANILAYANPLAGMLCQASDTGYWWAYYGGAWKRLDNSFLTAPLVITSLILDDQAPPDANANVAYGGLTFPNAGAWGWGDFKAWLDGAAWRFQLEGMMTTGSASAVGFNIAYLVAGTGAISGMVKTRRANSTPYALNDLRLPPVPNGHYYKCTTGGTSAASPPTFNTGGGSTTTDGTAVWTEQGASFKNLTLNVTAPATAYTPFSVDSATLQIPSGQVASGNRVYFALWRDPSDAHAGDLIQTEIKIQPVGV
jgi:hypothetical protein